MENINPGFILLYAVNAALWLAALYALKTYRPTDQN